jgi:hypothetical protein
MIKQMFALGSALVLSSFLYIGCADSVVDSSTATATTDPYMLLKVNDTEVNDFSEVPVFSEVCPNDSSADSNRHADDSAHMDGHRGGPHGNDGGKGHGREWMGRGEGRDFGRLANLGYRHIFQQLNLTPAQDSALKIYVHEFRGCAKSDYETYNAARKQAFDSLKNAIDEIRAAVDAGTLTRDIAKAQIQALVDTYRAEIAPLNATLKAAVAACRATFDTNFAAILTPEQLAIWNAKK